MLDFSFVQSGNFDPKERAEVKALLGDFVNYLVTHAYYTADVGDFLLLFEREENDFHQKINLRISDDFYDLFIYQRANKTSVTLSYRKFNPIKAFYSSFGPDGERDLIYEPSLSEIKQVIEILRKLISIKK